MLTYLLPWPSGILGINMKYLHQVNMDKLSLEASKQAYRKKKHYLVRKKKTLIHCK